MRFAALDGWRGICALLVAVHHFHAQSHLFALPFIRNGYLFVDFFFVLSGFVIFHAWGKRINWPADLLRFAIRRFARLWPLHAVVLALFVALEGAKALAMGLTGMAADNPPFSGETSVAALGTNLLLVHALGIHDGATWNFPSWSISTEFHTCLLFAGLCLLGVTRRTGGLAAMAVGGAGVVAGLSSEWLHTIADFGFFRCVYGFFVGALVHRLVALRLAGGLPGAPWLEAAAVAAVVAFVAASPKGAALSMAAPLVFGLAVAVFAFQAGPLSAMLLLPLPQALGRWSYSIYLIHSLLLVIIGRIASLIQRMADLSLTVPLEVNGQTRVLLVFGGPWGGDGMVLLYLVALTMLAAASWRWIEQPGQRLLAFDPNGDRSAWACRRRRG